MPDILSDYGVSSPSGTVTQMTPVWATALPFPCQTCGRGVNDPCVVPRTNRTVQYGNGPHMVRCARARGGYAWRLTKERAGADLLPGPSPDGDIP